MSMTDYYIRHELGIADGFLRDGMRVLLKPKLDLTIPGNPGLDEAEGTGGIMEGLAGSIVTVASASSNSWFAIYEDNRCYSWDPRWIECVMLEEEEFEPASDEMFAALFK